MNPETKFYLIIGVIVVSSSLTTAMFAYVAFKLALRRVVDGIARAAKELKDETLVCIPGDCCGAHCQSDIDLSVRCYSDEER